jgi:hypothetical protein
MAEIKAPEQASPAPRRPWYRLHLSTWVVLILIAGVLAILNVPGEIDLCMVGAVESFVIYGDHHLHGWPWEYLDRYPKVTGTKSTDEDINRAPWLIARCWNFQGKVKSFSIIWLLGDLSIASAILVLAAIFLEWRRRRYLRIWQFTLRELIVFAIIVAGICSWWMTNHLYRQKEKEIILALEKIANDSVCDEEYRGPTFLRKLIGLNYLADFYITNEFFYDDIIDEDNQNISKKQIIEKLLPLVVKLQYVESIYIASTELTDESLKITINNDSSPAICRLKRLKKLSLWSANITDKTVELLNNLTQLKDLEILGTGITPTGFKKLQKSLPQCEILYDTSSPASQ